jgi:hypothetical protein
MAYIARKDAKWSLIVDGEGGPEYDDVDRVFFSPDGKHVAYQAKKGLKWVMVSESWEGPEHDEIIGKASPFRADGTIEYLVVKDKILYRVRL